MKRTIKPIIALIFFIGVFALIKITHVTDYISMHFLQENMALLQKFVVEHYGTAVLIYLCSYILASAVSLPGSSIFLTAAGLLFGTFVGMIFALLGATIGAMLLFLLSRYLIGSWVQERDSVRLKKFNHEIAMHGSIYLLMARVFGALPFCVINMFSGLTLVPLHTFIWTTFVGMIPLTLICTYAGHQCAACDASSAFPFLFSFVFIGMRIAAVPLIYAYWQKRRMVR